MNNKLTSRLLASAITTLERALVPEPKSDNAAIMLDVVIRTLRMLEAHYGHRAEDLGQLIADSRTLLADNLALAIPSTRSLAGDSLLEQLEAEKNILNEQIAEQIPALLEQASGTGDGAADAIALLQKIVATQTAFLAAQDPNILEGSADVYRGGKIDRSKKVEVAPPVAPITDGTVTAYLQAKFPDVPGICARAVNVLGGGFSKNTILFDIHKPGGLVEPCVIRKDMSADFLMMEKTVIDEYPILEKVYRAGLRVAEPLWLETDKSWFNGAFIVSRAVPGTSDIAKWISNKGAVSQQLAEIMAELHGYGLEQLGFGPEVATLSAGESIRQEILHWKSLYEKYRTYRHPLLEMGFTWLLQNVPRELFAQPGRIVHGDIGFHNLMVKDGQVTALLDWEFSHFGAPAEDLIYVRAFVEQIADWNEFLVHYRNAGGGDYSREVETFYKVWSFVRNASGTRHAHYLFEHHLPDEIKLALPAWIHGFYLELDASKLVLDILAQNHTGP